MIEQQINQANYEKRRRIVENATRMIWITFSREGIHAYPAAGTAEELADVAFLAHPHRHMFHFKIHIDVFHSDRDIEFIQFKRWTESLFDDKILQLDNKSCEMISDELFHHIAKKYPHRDIWINVSEDNENGAEIRYLK